MQTTARSMKDLRKKGWMVCRVEQRLRIPGAPFPRTVDAFNFGDLLAAHPEHGVALFQCTSTGEVSRRLQKILTIQISKKDTRLAAVLWLQAGGKIYVHGWAKRGPRGKRKMWELSESEVRIE